MTTPLRIAIAGCGGIADYVARLLRWTPGIRAIAACDIDPTRLASFAHRHKIQDPYTDYAQMLADPAIQAVYLAVPHHLHFPMIQAAMEAGKHVLVEKPVTRTLAEGREIAASAAQAGIKLGVNYQYRYDRGCHALARAVQEGALGRPLYARVNVPWHRDWDYFEGSPWHQSLAQAGGGTLITQASHLLDIALWAMGGAPISAMGYIARAKFTQVEVEDLAQATVELDTGALVQICTSMVASPEGAVNVEIYGERGTAVYTNKPWPRVRFHGVRVKRQPPPYFGLHALQRCLKGFRDWVLHDHPFLIPAKEALPVLATVEAIYQSAALGQRVEITTGAAAKMDTPLPGGGAY